MGEELPSKRQARRPADEVERFGKGEGAEVRLRGRRAPALVIDVVRPVRRTGGQASASFEGHDLELIVDTRSSAEERVLRVQSPAHVNVFPIAGANEDVIQRSDG